MSLPIGLSYGLVSIYGIGFQTYVAGIEQPPGMLYGRVDAVSQHDIFNAVVGETVYFKESDVVCRLAYPTENTSFTIVPDAQLVCTVVIPP